MTGSHFRVTLLLGVILVAMGAMITTVAGQDVTRSTTKTSRRGSRFPKFPGIKPRARQCKSVPFGVEKFLRAQTGFPSNLRQFFPPAFDVLGEATPPAMAGATPPSIFALADIHGAMDAWVQQQIECECGGNKDSAGCRYKEWQPWKAIKATVETCGTGSGKREEIRVKIKAKNVFVFAQSVDALTAAGFDFQATDAIFGDKLTSKTPIDTSKWVFGESNFEWTFNKNIDVDMGLVNFFLRTGEPPPNSDANKWTPLDLTPYRAEFQVKAKSGSECLIVEATKKDNTYLPIEDGEEQDSFDTPKIIQC